MLLGNSAAAGDKDAAEALFQEGRKLMDQKDYAAACPKFEASMKEDPSVGALLNLARCNEGRERLATAWRQYREAADMAEKEGQQRRAEGARQYAKRLRGDIPKLVVAILEPVDGLEIMLDGRPLHASDWNQPYALDPGVYQVEARASGYETIRREVTIVNTPKLVWLKLPPLKSSKPPEPTPVPDPAPKPDPVEPKPVQPPSPQPLQPVQTGLSTPQLAGLLVGSFGIASVAVGTAFGITAIQDTAALDGSPDCPTRDTCSPEGLAERDTIRTRAHVSTATLAIGGAALVGATVLLIVGDRDDEAESPTSVGPVAVTPLIGPGTIALDARLRF